MNYWENNEKTQVLNPTPLAMWASLLAYLANVSDIFYIMLYFDRFGCCLKNDSDNMMWTQEATEIPPN